MNMLSFIPKLPVPLRYLLPAAPLAIHAAVPIDFEDPPYVVGDLASITPGLVDKNFNGQDGWSESTSNSPGVIAATSASGEYVGGQALTASTTTYIGAKSGYHLLQDGSDTFTFDIRAGASQTGIGFWSDTDGDGLFDQAEAQIHFGFINSAFQFGYRRPAFGTVALSGTSGTSGHWYRFVVTVGEPDEETGDRQITMRVRNLTASSEVDFDPETPGTQPWIFTVTPADFGTAPEEWDGTFVRVTAGAIDNINGPIPPPPAGESVWDGEGSNGNWSTAANWVGDTLPSAGDTLTFSGSGWLLSANDLAPGLAVSGLAFDMTAGNFELTGSAIELTGALRNEGSSAQTIVLPISLPADLAVIAASGSLYLDGVLSGPGGIAKSGPGLLLLTGANTYSGGLSVVTGTVDLEGDQSGADGGFQVSNLSNSTVNIISGGQAAVRNDAEILLGVPTTTDTGTATLNVGGSLDSSGALSLLRGGRLNVNGTVDQSGPVVIAGVGGYGAQMEVFPTGTFTYTGEEPIILRSGTNNNGRGRIIVNGGVFVTGAGFAFDSDSEFTGFLSLRQGGVLRLSSPVAGLTTEAAAISLVLDPGGGEIDTNGHDTAIPTPVSGSGSLTKSGAGTLRVDLPGYTGDTLVSGGVLSLGAPTLADTSYVEVAAGATLHLDFTGQNIVGSLTLEDTVMEPGTYNAASHPGLLAGDGSLVVASSGSGFAAWAQSLGLSGDPGSDDDDDSLPDAVEYVLGTDPKAPNPSGIVAAASGADFIFTFDRDQDSKTPDVTLAVELGPDLETWPTVLIVGASTVPSVPEVTVTDNGDGTETIAVTVPRGEAPGLFARLRVTIAP